MLSKFSYNLDNILIPKLILQSVSFLDCLGLMNEVLFLTCALFRIFVKGRKEVVFLLCGSDQSVHLFCEVSLVIIT